MAGSIQYTNFPSPITPAKNPMIISYQYANYANSGFYYEIKTLLNNAVINLNKLHPDTLGYGVSNTQAALLPYMGSTPVITQTDVWTPVVGVIQPYKVTVGGYYSGGSNTLYSSGNLYALDGYWNAPQEKKNWDFTDYLINSSDQGKFLSHRSQTQKVTTYANCQGELRTLWGSFSGSTNSSYADVLILERNGIGYYEYSSGSSAPYYNWNTTGDTGKYCLSNQFTPWCLSNLTFNQIGSTTGGFQTFNVGDEYSIYLGKFDSAGAAGTSDILDYSFSKHINKNTFDKTDDAIQITGQTCVYGGKNLISFNNAYAFPNPNGYFTLGAINTPLEINLFNENPIDEPLTSGTGNLKGYSLTNGLSAGSYSGLTLAPSATYTTTNCIHNTSSSTMNYLLTGATTIVAEATAANQYFIMNLKDTSIAARQVIDAGGETPYKTIVINKTYFTMGSTWTASLLDASNNVISNTVNMSPSDGELFYYLTLSSIGVQATKIKFTATSITSSLSITHTKTPMFFEQNDWYTNQFAITQGEELYVYLSGMSWNRSGAADCVMFLSDNTNQYKLASDQSQSVEYAVGNPVVDNADSDIHQILHSTSYTHVYRLTPNRTGNSRLHFKWNINTGDKRITSGTIKVKIVKVKGTARQTFSVNNQQIIKNLVDWYDDFYMLVKYSGTTLNLTANALTPKETYLYRASEIKNFKVICPATEETNTLNSGKWIAWKNSVGGYDYQLFDLKSGEELEIEKQTYKRNNIRPTLDGSYYNYDYDITYGEEKVYRPDVTQIITARVELSAEELKDIRELFYSDQVYEYVARDFETLTLPIIILDKKVSFPNASKKMLVEVTYKYSDNFIC